jgi:heat-inducible transcriptional repressor
MKVKDMSVAETVAVKEKMWDFRQEADKLLREATKTLAESTKALAITATEDGDLYYAGAANILEMPEFYDYQLTHSLFEALDEYDYWWNILSHRTDPFDIMIGEDMGLERLLSRCGFVYHKFKTPHMSGAIGVVGPSRLNYSQVVPVVRYVGDLIVEFAGNW